MSPLFACNQILNINNINIITKLKKWYIMINTIDNFLDTNIFLNIQKILFDTNFPYYYHSAVASEQDNSDFYFNHTFYSNNQQQSSFFSDIVLPIIIKYGFKKKLIRAKCNLYTK